MLLSLHFPFVPVLSRATPLERPHYQTSEFPTRLRTHNPRPCCDVKSQKMLFFARKENGMFPHFCTLQQERSQADQNPSTHIKHQNRLPNKSSYIEEKKTSKDLNE